MKLVSNLKGYLLKAFCIAMLSILLFGCENKMELQLDKDHSFDFDSETADSLYQVIKSKEYSDMNELQLAAEQMKNLPDSKDARLVGEYYLIKALFFKKGDYTQIQQMKSFYTKIKDKGENFDQIRLDIDFLIIGHAYRNLQLDTVGERIKSTLDYIYAEKYEVERTALIHGLSSLSSQQNYGEKLADLKSVIDNFKEDEWSFYHSKVTFEYVRALRRVGDTLMFDIIVEDLIEKNKTHNILTELGEVYLYLNLTIEGRPKDKEKSKENLRLKKQYLERAINLALKIEYTYTINIFYRNLGHVYFQEKNFKEAYNFYTKALEVDSSINNFEGYAIDLMYKSWAYFRIDPEKNYQESLKLYEKALEFDPNSLRLDIMIKQRHLWSLNILGKINNINNSDRIDKINKIKSEIKRLEESHENESNKQKLVEFKNRLQLRFSDMNHKISALDNANKLKDASLERQRYFMLFSASLLALFSFILYGYKKRVSLMNQIENQNQIIKSKNIALKDSLERLQENQNKLNKTNKDLETILTRREKIILRLQRFAGILAHDFKEPVRTIVSFGQILNRTLPEKINNSENEFLDIIIESTQRLMTMTNRLYDYSNNTLALMKKFRSVNLNNTILNVRKDLQSKLVSKNGELIVAPLCHVLGDDILLYQLFLNLISNSLKYSRPEVSPKVIIKNEIKGNNLIISISDNGRGIKETPNLDIFALFSREHTSSNQEGHGLGLATCKEIVEIHGGTISYTSEIGIGTTFYVSFIDFERNKKTIVNKG